MTIETIAEQIKLLTEQVAKLDAIVNKTTSETTTTTTTTTTESTPKKPKKEKKEKKEKSTSDDDKPKKVSGYILFSKANREDAIETLQAAGEGDAKIKSTDVMKELGRMWKELDTPEKDDWNIKAKAMVEAA
jgi:hypothetical protein